MIFSRLYILPIITSIMLPFTFLITYSVSVLDGHVNSELPYISDTGTNPPESCIFAQFLNIAAFLISICFYVRFLEIKYYPELSGTGEQISLKLNNVSHVLGQQSCLGLDLVANFQVTNIAFMHVIGAILLFSCATIYFILQVFISKKMTELVPRYLVVIRAILVVSCIVTSFITVPTTIVAMIEYRDPKEDRTKTWTLEDCCYDMRLLSVVTEWILALSLCSLILTFAPEF